MSAPSDNIAADEESVVGAGTEADIDMDEYLSQFDKVGDSNVVLANTLKLLAKAQHDQERIQVLSQYCSQLQKQNELLYDLLVQMNNVFGQAK